ncbi:hypothetical protein [Nonomuraea salmonea]|uniref:hypothetical protein n=1 Tax=Nonomuraea salmonea TaxID=46181 RepID=UPI0031E9EABA
MELLACHEIDQTPTLMLPSSPATIANRGSRRRRPRGAGGTGVAYRLQPSESDAAVDRRRSRIGRPYGGRPTRRGSSEGF